MSEALRFVLAVLLLLIVVIGVIYLFVRMWNIIDRDMKLTNERIYKYGNPNLARGQYIIWLKTKDPRYKPPPGYIPPRNF
jgi:Na+-transporting methylmalonyl-CoA/oxaloacetate decarboxylase gamma subunit